jgi:protein TonB
MSFEAFLTQDRQRPKTGRRITYSLSLALHGLALVVAIGLSFTHVDELSPPNATVTLVQPPAPPPPAASAGPRPTRRPSRRTTSEVVQPRPKETPEPPAEDPADDPQGRADDTAGVPGGLKGGVETGIIGTDPPQATFLPPKVATGRLAIDPQDPRYQAHLPSALARAGMSLWAMLKVCVRAEGEVSEVKVIRGADPTVDPLIVAAIMTWRYHPYTVDGRPVPFCTNIRYEMAASR